MLIHKKADIKNEFFGTEKEISKWTKLRHHMNGSMIGQLDFIIKEKRN